MQKCSHTNVASIIISICAKDQWNRWIIAEANFNSKLIRGRMFPVSSDLGLSLCEVFPPLLLTMVMLTRDNNKDSQMNHIESLFIIHPKRTKNGIKTCFFDSIKSQLSLYFFDSFFDSYSLSLNKDSQIITFDSQKSTWLFSCPFFYMPKQTWLLNKELF